MSEQPCPECKGEGRYRGSVKPPGKDQYGWEWRTCQLCGGSGVVTPEAAAKLKARAQRQREWVEQAEQHWVTRAADSGFAWLVHELGYQVTDRMVFRAGDWTQTYESDKTRIRAVVYTNRDPDLSVSLAPIGTGYCSINDCLEAHGLPTVDLRLPYSPGEELVVRRINDLEMALRELTPWEVGGHWELA